LPRVSVIIPTYNRAHFIAEAIRSVLSQTYRDFEIIVVDDGSTDNTKEVVNSFKDHHIRYIYQDNQRVCVARNNGIEVSKGEYIVLLDSDDVLMEKAIERELHMLERNPEVGLSYGQKYMMDEKGHIFALRKPKHRAPGVYRGAKEIINLFRYGNYIVPSTTMIRRSSIIDVGLFDPAFNAGSNDFEMWVRIAKKYAVAYIAEPVAKYRISSTSITNGRNPDEIEETNSRIFESVFNDPKIGALLSGERPKAYFHQYWVLANNAYGNREMNTARRYLFKALRLHPQGCLKGLGLPFILLYVKTCLPLPILGSARKLKHRLTSVILHKPTRV
jgi:glycosyltransferase involved in cell wall biosynthesis